MNQCDGLAALECVHDGVLLAWLEGTVHAAELGQLGLCAALRASVLEHAQDVLAPAVEVAVTHPRGHLLLLHGQGELDEVDGPLGAGRVDLEAATAGHFLELWRVVASAGHAEGDLGCMLPCPAPQGCKAGGLVLFHAVLDPVVKVPEDLPGHASEGQLDGAGWVEAEDAALQLPGGLHPLHHLGRWLADADIVLGHAPVWHEQDDHPVEVAADNILTAEGWPEGFRGGGAVQADAWVGDVLALLGLPVRVLGAVVDGARRAEQLHEVGHDGRKVWPGALGCHGLEHEPELVNLEQAAGVVGRPGQKGCA